jgi:GCN5-related N-acetyl-transferase
VGRRAIAGAYVLDAIALESSQPAAGRYGARVMSKEVDVVDAPDAARFEVRVDGELAGFVEYRRRPGVIAFVHTEIEPGFEGHGVASQLPDDMRASFGLTADV